MVLCRVCFHFVCGEFELAVDVNVELPECVVAKGVDLGFDDAGLTKLHGTIEQVNWWASSSAIEIHMQQSTIKDGLEEFGRQLLEDDRVVFVEYSSESSSIWSETRE